MLYDPCVCVCVCLALTSSLVGKCRYDSEFGVISCGHVCPNDSDASDNDHHIQACKPQFYSLLLLML